MFVLSNKKENRPSLYWFLLNKRELIKGETLTGLVEKWHLKQLINYNVLTKKTRSTLLIAPLERQKRALAPARLLIKWLIAVFFSHSNCVESKNFRTQRQNSHSQTTTQEYCAMLWRALQNGIWKRTKQNNAGPIRFVPLSRNVLLQRLGWNLIHSRYQRENGEGCEAELPKQIYGLFLLSSLLFSFFLLPLFLLRCRARVPRLDVIHRKHQDVRKGSEIKN